MDVLVAWALGEGDTVDAGADDDGFLGVGHFGGSGGSVAGVIAVDRVQGLDL